MDRDRQIRFLYPPFFFLAFLISAIVVDCPDAPKSWLALFDTGTEKILGVLVSGGVVVLVTGFLIGAVSNNMLRLLFYVFGGRRYEVVLTRDALVMIWPRLNTSQTIEQCSFGWRRQAFYAGVTLDHAILPKGIHYWLMRRWSAFNISVNSCVAISLAFLTLYYLGITRHRHWFSVAVAVVVLLLINAVVAWKETMAMLEFQAGCQPQPVEQRPRAGMEDEDEEEEDEEGG